MNLNEVNKLFLRSYENFKYFRKFGTELRFTHDEKSFGFLCKSIKNLSNIKAFFLYRELGVISYGNANAL